MMSDERPGRGFPADSLARQGQGEDAHAPAPPPSEEDEDAEERRPERVPPAVEDQPADAKIDPICRPTTIEAIYAGARRTG